MKKIALVLVCVMFTSTVAVQLAQACGDRIYDLQNNPSKVGTLGVPCEVIITATRYNGFFCQQLVDPAVNPNGEYSGIWVYTNTDSYSTTGVPYAVGDSLAVCGVVTEYNDLTELDVVAGGTYGYVTYLGSTTPPAPFYVTAAQLDADGEPWESVQITIIDGMGVPAGFDLGYGEWNVDALDGTGLIFDDYWYDFASVTEGQCYNNATGIYTYSFGAFKLEPFADGIPTVDCAVGVQSASLGSIKAMYR